jgi:hypothetical protein
MPDLITLEEAVGKFDVGIATLYRHLKAGRLRRYKQGGRESRGIRTFVDRAELRRLLKPQPVRPARKTSSLPRSGYVRTTDRFRHPKRAPRSPQRKGESDKDYATRIDGAREQAFERERRRRRR